MVTGMKGPSDSVLEQFADAFAQRGKGKGLSAQAVVEWFAKYSHRVRPWPWPSPRPSKREVFIQCVRTLPGEEQYRSLLEITSLAESIRPAIGESEVNRLLAVLCTDAKREGYGLRLIRNVCSGHLNREWLKSIDSLEDHPETAIAQARTMLEKVCISVITAIEQQSPEHGNLPRLVKDAFRATLHN